MCCEEEKSKRKGIVFKGWFHPTPRYAHFIRIQLVLLPLRAQRTRRFESLKLRKSGFVTKPFPNLPALFTTIFQTRCPDETHGVFCIRSPSSIRRRHGAVSKMTFLSSSISRTISWVVNRIKMDIIKKWQKWSWRSRNPILVHVASINNIEETMKENSSKATLSPSPMIVIFS